MTRGDTANTTYPVVLSPRKTLLLNTRPTIRWVPVAGAKKGTTYKVSLYGDNRKLLWSGDGSVGAELSYPEQEPPLTAGQTYKVVVSTDTSSSDEEHLPDLGFTLLTADEAANVSAAEKAVQQKNLSKSETRFLVSNLYASKGLYAEAIDQLEALSKTVHEPAVACMLGDLYMRVGLNREAEKRYLDALSLTEANDVEGQASIQYKLAQAYESLGSYDLAAAKLGEAINAYTTLENRSMADELTTKQQKLKDRVAP
jgi:tetratricopeptide (TPR) repeat protein